eukprot:10191658-Ditylum_brightwellii.AAC.1
MPAPVAKTTMPAPVAKPFKSASVAKPMKPAPVTKSMKPAPVAKPFKPAPVTKPMQPASVAKPMKPVSIAKPMKPAPASKPVNVVKKTVSGATSESVIKSNKTAVTTSNKTAVTTSNKTITWTPECDSYEYIGEPLSPYADGTVNGWNMAAEGRTIGVMNTTTGKPISTTKNYNMFDNYTVGPGNVTSVLLDGGCLKTCSFTKIVDRVEVNLQNDGKPLNSAIELWQGPNNSPQKMRVYSEDGNARPFRAVIETPYSTNTVAIKNTDVDYPFTAVVDHTLKNVDGDPTVSPAQRLAELGFPKKIQGRATHSHQCDPDTQ